VGWNCSKFILEAVKKKFIFQFFEYQYPNHGPAPNRRSLRWRQASCMGMPYARLNPLPVLLHEINHPYPKVWYLYEDLTMILCTSFDFFSLQKLLGLGLALSPLFHMW